MSLNATFQPTLLISAQEVVQASFEDGRNFKTVKIKSEVIVAAQEKWIRPILGEPLYAMLIHAITNSSTGTIDPVLMRLWSGYVKPSLAYYVKYLLLPMISRPITNMGLQSLETDHSRGVSYKDIKSAQESALTIANSLAESLSRFLEQHKADYPAYRSSQNVKQRTRRIGGVVLSRRLPKHDYAPTSLAPAIASQYTHLNTTNDYAWVFSYQGLIRNEGVQVAKIFDAQGNDITDYANILVNDDTQTVLLTFPPAAFLNPNDKTGSVLLMTQEVLQAASLLSAIIEIEDQTATASIIEGRLPHTSSFKWYSLREVEERERLLPSSEATVEVSHLYGTGYLRCEIWDSGQRLLSVFERFYRPLSDGVGELVTDGENIDISEL